MLDFCSYIFSPTAWPQQWRDAGDFDDLGDTVSALPANVSRIPSIGSERNLY